jgi:hypothetical protein
LTELLAGELFFRYRGVFLPSRTRAKFIGSLIAFLGPLLLLPVLVFAACPANGPVFWISAIAANYNANSSWATSSGGVTCSAAGNYAPGPANIVTFDGKGVGNCTFVAAVTVTSMTISTSSLSGYTGTVNTGNFNLTISSNFVQNHGTFAAGSSSITVGGSWTENAASVFTVGTSTIGFNGTSTGLGITNAGKPFNNLQINGVGGYWTLLDSMTVNSTMTVTAGTLDASANNYGISVGRDWLNNGGIFIAHQSTVTFTGASTTQKIHSNGKNFANVLFNGGGNWVLQDSMTVVSTMTLASGNLNTNAASNFGISLGGDWLTTGGNFTVNLSTVTLIGTTGQKISNAGQAFWILYDSNTTGGGVAFASSFTAAGLVVNGSSLASATTIYFNAGSTYTLTNLTMNGSSGKTVWIRPRPAGQQWFLDNVTTNTVSFVDVAYSSASVGQVIVAGPNSTDSGNNVHWTFLILAVSLDKHSYDFTTVSMGVTTLSTSAVATATNMGNATETYSLSVTTTGALSVWGVGTSTPTSANTFVLEGLFNSIQPSTATFTSSFVITSTPTASTAGIYAGNQTGLSTSIGSQRPLWLFLFMPSSTSTANQELMNLTITASSP